MDDFLRVSDLDGRELASLLEFALAAKRDPRIVGEPGRGKSVAVLFEKPSLRTRFSIEAALVRVGAHPIGAYDREVGLGRREPVEDVGRVLERYVDAIVIRTFEHARVEALAASAAVPVINALSDAHHPLQTLADLLTLVEACCGGQVDGLARLKVAYVGDGNNVANSLIEGAALVGLRIAVATPPGHEPAVRTGVELYRDPVEAVRGADAVYTDVWTSMGQEEEAEARAADFAPYRVTARLMAQARPGAIFLHCLPAHRGQEVDGEVIDGPASRVFEQAANRLHTAVAVFASLFGRGS